MSVIMVIPYIGTRFGGPVFGLASTVRGITERGGSTVVLCGQSQNDGKPVTFSPNVSVRSTRVYEAAGFRWCPGMTQLLNQAVAEGGEIVHSHGLWTDTHRRAAATARRLALPHVISPCGMLARDAVRRRWVKKIPAQWMFQDRALRETKCLHATSYKELSEIREYGLQNPVAVIPLPIDSEIVGEDVRLDFRRKHGLTSPQRYALFLGRVHPVKHVDALLEAWAVSAADWPEWRLLVAGPEEPMYRASLDRLVRTLHLGDRVRFLGELRGQEKWAAYASAELFVMPSLFENFCLAIGEAASVGLPVITTTGTPWKMLQEQRGGWWVASSPDALADALLAAFATKADELASMGRRAQLCVSGFRMQAVAAQFVDLYRWIGGAIARPSWVAVA